MEEKRKHDEEKWERRQQEERHRWELERQAQHDRHMREVERLRNEEFVHSRDCRSWLCQVIWWLCGRA